MSLLALKHLLKLHFKVRANPSISWRCSKFAFVESSLECFGLKIVSIGPEGHATYLASKIQQECSTSKRRETSKGSKSEKTWEYQSLLSGVWSDSRTITVFFFRWRPWSWAGVLLFTPQKCSLCSQCNRLQVAALEIMLNNVALLFPATNEETPHEEFWNCCIQPHAYVPYYARKIFIRVYKFEHMGPTRDRGRHEYSRGEEGRP